MKLTPELLLDHGFIISGRDLQTEEEAERLGMPKDWQAPEINGVWENKSLVGISQLNDEDKAIINAMAAQLEEARETTIIHERRELEGWLYPLRLQIVIYKELAYANHPPDERTRSVGLWKEAARLLGAGITTRIVVGEIVATTREVVRDAPLIIQSHHKTGAARLAAYVAKDLKHNGRTPQILNAGEEREGFPIQLISQGRNDLYVRQAILCLMTRRPFPNLPIEYFHRQWPK